MFVIGQTSSSATGEGEPMLTGNRTDVRRTVWMLALAAGYVDGIGLLYLGGVFSSVAAGNLVVLGVSAVRDVTDTALRAGLAVAVYAGTVLLARRVPARLCLVAELLA